MQAARKDIFSRTHKCLYPGCSENAIKSHSQQRGGPLKLISEQNEVYAVDSTIIRKSEKREYFKRQKITQASIFEGFCSGHDNTLFEIVESRPVSIEDEKSLYLLFLRAVCFEYCTKRFGHELNSCFRKRAHKHLSDSQLAMYDQLEKEREVFTNVDGPRALQDAFEILSSEKWNDLVNHAFVIDRNIGISSASTMSIKPDQSWGTLQDIMTAPQPYITFTVIPYVDCTIISLSAFKKFENDAMILFNTINDENLMSEINYLAFSRTEDTCVNPSLWESISDGDRLALYSAAFGDYSEAVSRAILPQVIV